MNRLVAIAGMAVLAGGLIGWAALAWAQSGTEKGATGSDPSAEVGGAEPVGKPVPLVDGPGKAESGMGQPLPVLKAATPPAAPGTSPPSPDKDGPSVAPLGLPPQPGSADKTPVLPDPQGPKLLPMPGKPEAMD